MAKLHGFSMNREKPWLTAMRLTVCGLLGAALLGCGGHPAESLGTPPCPRGTSGESCKPCSAGQYCAGAATAPIDCGGDTFDHDGSPETNCKPLRTCPTGTFTSTEGTPTADRTCAACAAGQYCPGGAAPPIDCESGTFDDDANPQTPCVPVSNCQPGSFVQIGATATSDATCAKCEPGTYAALDNAPSCEACPEGTFSSQPGAAECAAWRTCGVDAEENAPGTASSDRVCVPWTTSWTPSDTAQRCIERLVPTEDGGLFATSGGVLTRLDASGNIVWTKVRGNRVSVLADGTLAIIDASVVKKLDPEGKKLWELQLPATTPRDIALSAQGDVFVAADWTTPESSDSQRVILLKLDAQGLQSWSQEFSVSDAGISLQVDGLSNAYLARTEERLEATDVLRDSTVLKVSPDGDALNRYSWTTVLHSGSVAGITALGHDQAGGTYACGHAQALDDAIEPSDVPEPGPFLMKLREDWGPSEPNVQGASWVRQWTDDRCLAITGDAEGNVFVGGEHEVDGDENEVDFFLAKLDSNGDELWRKVWGPEGPDSVTAVAVDDAGTLFVGGCTGDEGEVFISRLTER